MKKEQHMNMSQGHWVLAKMGKKVLRPGGKELSLKMIEALDINAYDDVVEFAPGLGFTAEIALSKNPKTYTGIELNEEAVKILKAKLKSPNVRIITGNAAQSTLPPNSVDKVYGEAMLTMQADHRKAEIIREAFRVLKPGGLYGIHELGLTPNDLSEDKKSAIQKELAIAIKVNARPLTVSEWSKILEQEGFVVKKVETNLMHLLEFKRLISDEGLWGTLKIMFNVLRNREARSRILAMRKVFIQNSEHLNAVSIIAEKKAEAKQEE